MAQAARLPLGGAGAVGGATAGLRARGGDGGLRAEGVLEVEAELAAQDGAPFPATLCGLDGDGIDDAGLASERMAKDAVERIRAGTFAVLSVERDTLRRQSLPPFTTATLQQEARARGIRQSAIILPRPD